MSCNWPCGLVPSRLLPSCLLPFRLLKIKLCHFAYSAKNSFSTQKKSIQATELQQVVKRCFFHLAQALNQKISTLGLLFIHQTVTPVFVPLRFVQLAWNRPRLQPLICPELMSIVCTLKEHGWWAIWVARKAHPNLTDCTFTSTNRSFDCSACNWFPTTMKCCSS